MATGSSAETNQTTQRESTAEKWHEREWLPAADRSSAITPVCCSIACRLCWMVCSRASSVVSGAWSAAVSYTHLTSPTK